MQCSFCKVSKIGPEILPYGGFICPGGHLQCFPCTFFSKENCCLCGKSTQFVKMAYKPAPPSSVLSNMIQGWATNFLRTKPRLESNDPNMKNQEKAHQKLPDIENLLRPRTESDLKAAKLESDSKDESDDNTIEETHNPEYLASMGPKQNTAWQAANKFVIFGPRLCINEVEDKELFYPMLLRPVNLQHIRISRRPIQCPDTRCKCPISALDLCAHFLNMHSTLTMQHLHIRVATIFKMDARISLLKGVASCKKLFLVSNVIENLGDSELKDFLPIVLMGAHGKLSDFDLTAPLNNEDFFIIWLCTLEPTKLNLSFKLALPKNENFTLEYQNEYFTPLYSFRQSQKVSDVYESGQCLIMSHATAMRIADQRTKLLNFEIEIR